MPGPSRAGPVFHPVIGNKFMETAMSIIFQLVALEMSIRYSISVLAWAAFRTRGSRNCVVCRLSHCDRFLREIDLTREKAAHVLFVFLFA